jgi:hypothetical protein
LHPGKLGLLTNGRKQHEIEVDHESNPADASTREVRPAGRRSSAEPPAPVGCRSASSSGRGSFAAGESNLELRAAVRSQPTAELG